MVISKNLASKLKPGSRTSFRVRGTLDSYPIQKTSILPMGNGDFILPMNASFRKGTGKRDGDVVKVQLEIDNRELVPTADFVRCLKDVPGAYEHFQSLPRSHRNYFIKWLEGAKTLPTKTKRITMAVIALGAGQGFVEMVRSNKKK